MRIGLAIAAAALALDYVFVGTFRPPQKHVPALLEIAPWSVYAGMFAVWAGVFRVLNGPRGALSAAWRTPAGRSLVRWGMLAALAAFLFHSTAEITFRVPALGGSVFALAAIALAGVTPPRERRVGAVPWAAGLILLALAPAFVLATVVCPRVMDYDSAMNDVFRLKGKPVTGNKAFEALQELLAAYRKAVRAIPWDDEGWEELGRNAYFASGMTRDRNRRSELAREAEAACRRATSLDKLKAKNWRILAEIVEAAGRRQEAVEYYRRAAELHQSVPISWLDYAQAADRAEGPGPEACGAYRRAADLNVRIVDERGAVLRGQYHTRNLLSPEDERLLREGLARCGRR